MKPSPRRAVLRFLVLTATLGAASAVAGACSGESPLPGALPDTDSGVADHSPLTNGPCSPEGATQKCGFTIGVHGGVTTCYEGEQTCSNAAWGPCESGTVQNHQTPGQPTGNTGTGTSDLPAANPGLHTLALSDAGPCVANPCDPACQNFNDIPETGVGVSDVVVPPNWVQGALGDVLPSLNSVFAPSTPCYWGADCNYDMQCKNVATKADCNHSKCVTGSAFDQTCQQADPCVKTICAADSSCCGGSTCTHTVCATGAALLSTCSTCAGTVCAANATCCDGATGSWSAACVTLAETLCTAGTCDCAAGETKYNGHCYKYNGTGRKWDAARTYCQGLGAGWDMADITSAAENTAVTTQAGTSAAWIGSIDDNPTEGVYGWVTGESFSYSSWSGNQPDGGNTANCAYLDGTNGTWYDDACTATHGYVCESTAGVSACKVGETEYNNLCYKVTSSSSAWSDAACTAYDSTFHLAEIDSAAQNTALNALVSSGTWLGLNDSATEGSMVWNVTGLAPTYTNWATEPNLSGAGCAYLGTDGYWKDEACTGSKPVLCEVGTTAGCSTGMYTLASGKCAVLFTGGGNKDTWYNANIVCTTSPYTGLVNFTNATDSVGLEGASYFNGTDFWLGYSDQTTESTFVWSDGGSLALSGLVTFTGNSANNDCAAQTAAATYSVARCNNNADKYNYACERTPPSSCPTGSTSIGSRCYKVTAAALGSGMAAACTALGSSFVPASLDGATENADVLAAAGLITADTWIGATDTAGDVWSWTDGSAWNNANSHWDTEPTNYPASADCAAMSSDGSWSDEVCTDSKPSLCVGPKLAACAAGSSAYGTSCYTFVTTLTSKAAAATACAALVPAATLATIDSSGENAFIDSNTTAATWVGYSDAVTEATWLWDGGAGSGYVNWHQGTPPVTGNQDCVDTTSGVWDDQSCMGSEGVVCEGPPLGGLSAGTWTASCVAKVSTLCNATCGTGSPPNGSGTCESYEPGDLNPNCTGLPDLSVPPVCGALSITVCNRGPVAAPAGVVVKVFPANSNQYQWEDCSPPLSAAQDDGTCVTTVPIPPGECVGVPCPSGLQGNVNAIIVNPSTLPAADYKAECSCLDNWSLNNKTADCNPPACATTDVTLGGSTGACSYTVPAGQFDPAVTKLNVLSSAQLTTLLTRRTSLADCNDPVTSAPREGWYYDTPGWPTAVILCPTSCTAGQADVGPPAANLNIDTGCPLLITQQNYAQQYSATCPYGQGVQWGYLTYDASTPDDPSTPLPTESTITFEIRAASTAAGVASATPTTVATLPPDADLCALPGCSVDLYAKLGLPNALLPFIEVRIKTTPDGTAVPFVRSWKISYSCVDNQ